MVLISCHNKSGYVYKRGYRTSQRGSVLVVALIILAILLALGIGLLNMVTINTKSVSARRSSFVQFQNADGGIYAVSGWMYFYKRGIAIPKEVTETPQYRVYAKPLANTIYKPVGYSEKWAGFDERLTSFSGNTEIEAVVFVPVAPAGYGNGG